MKKNTSTEQLLGELSGFVSRDEIKQLEKFESELNRLTDQLCMFKVPTADERADALQREYSKSPTDENFKAYTDAAIHAAIVERIVSPNVHAVIEGARERFVKEQVLPWVKPILERGLKIARDVANAIIEEEKKRHEKLIGQAPANSPIIAAVTAPVREIERLLNAGAGHGLYEVGNIFKFLHAHVAAADA